MFPQLISNKESNIVLWSMGHDNSEWTEEDESCGYVSTEVDKNILIDPSQDYFCFLDSFINKNNIQAQFQVLNSEINKLNREIKTLKSELNNQEILELRDIPFNQARKEIKEWIACRENSWYYSDIVDELGLDLEIVIKVIDDLHKDGIRIIEQE